MLGIFGGTFDPIHFGHLRVALDVVEALDLKCLHLVPLRLATHREQPLASPTQRMAMIKIAIRDEPRLRVDDRELRRQGPSYTVDTLRAIRAENSNQTLCLLLGSDAFEGFLDWHQPYAILELAHVVVMQRPGFRVPRDSSLGAVLAERQTDRVNDLAQNPGGKIFCLQVTQLSISSTAIREQLREGLSARYLTPDKVLQYIESESLYLSMR